MRTLTIQLCVMAILAIVSPTASHALLPAPQDTARVAKNPESKKDGEKVVDPAADSAREVRRREAATNRALFAADETVRFTLVANYGAISRDRDTLSTKRFDGTIVVPDTSGAERRIPVQLRTRGHFRLLTRNCRFVPLRIDFPDSGLKGTPFAGQKSLKLGAHCQGDGRFDNYTRREYLANRLYNVLTDASLRVRMAQGLYLDSASGKTVDDRPALFFENEDEVARRLGGKIQEWRGAVFDDVDAETLLMMAMFEYGIGNTDWSIFALHNIRLAAMPNGTIMPIAYDFDFSGLVNAHYASPDPRMGIKSVRDRLYRGPCLSLEQVQAAAAHINGKREALLAEIEAVPGFSKDEQAQALRYLEPFFNLIKNPGAVKRTFVDECDRKPGV